MNSFKLYLPTDLTSPLDSNLTLSQKQQLFGTKLDFKNSCGGGIGAGGSSNGSGNVGSASTTGAGTQNLCISSSSPDSQQFNIFPAIFSRQLNFSTTAGGSCGQGKLMDELRPNLVGGLLGLQQGILDDHALSHGNLQHGSQDSKFMTLQDNRLMGISSHENRLLGLSQDVRSSVVSSVDNKNSGQRKCSSTPEDFSALYGGLSTTGIADTSSHHHTPNHTPPSSRLADHTITGKKTNEPL